MSNYLLKDSKQARRAGKSLKKYHKKLRKLAKQFADAYDLGMQEKSSAARSGGEGQKKEKDSEGNASTSSSAGKGKSKSDKTKEQKEKEKQERIKRLKINVLSVEAVTMQVIARRMKKLARNG